MSAAYGHPVRTAAAQRGIALISSLLLLLIITIVALSMFRSFGTQERLAGNVREKERALHAAVSAQQYAEWWLTVPTNLAAGSVTCTTGVLSALANQGQICSNQLGPLGWNINVTAVPWTVTGVGGGLLGTTYQPTGMTVGGAGTPGNPPYYALPIFYIADLGSAADGKGEAYQIDAAGYGGSANAVAVVESTLEVLQGVKCTTCGQ